MVKAACIGILIGLGPGTSAVAQSDGLLDVVVPEVFREAASISASDTVARVVVSPAAYRKMGGDERGLSTTAAVLGVPVEVGRLPRICDESGMACELEGRGVYVRDFFVERQTTNSVEAVLSYDYTWYARRLPVVCPRLIRVVITRSESGRGWVLSEYRPFYGC